MRSDISHNEKLQSWEHQMRLVVNGKIVRYVNSTVRLTLFSREGCDITCHTLLGSLR